MEREDIKNRIKVNVDKLFLNGEMLGIQDEYPDNVNFSYIEENEKFYKLAGLIR